MPADEFFLHSQVWWWRRKIALWSDTVLIARLVEL